MEYKGEKINTTVVCFLDLEKAFEEIINSMKKMDKDNIDTCGDCLDLTSKVKNVLHNLKSISKYLPDHNSKALINYCDNLHNLLTNMEIDICAFFDL